MNSPEQKRADELEDKRAFRIALRINLSHDRLASIYEDLVDKEYQQVELNIKAIIMDLRLILKSIEDDDF